MQVVHSKQHKEIVGSVNGAPYTVSFDADGFAEVDKEVAAQLTSADYGVVLIDEDGAEVTAAKAEADHLAAEEEAKKAEEDRLAAENAQKLAESTPVVTTDEAVIAQENVPSKSSSKSKAKTDGGAAQ